MEGLSWNLTWQLTCGVRASMSGGLDAQTRSLGPSRLSQKAENISQLLEMPFFFLAPGRTRLLPS